MQDSIQVQVRDVSLAIKTKVQPNYLQFRIAQFGVDSIDIRWFIDRKFCNIDFSKAVESTGTKIVKSTLNYTVIFGKKSIDTILFTMLATI